jgi:tetratricopeptide (TPR) repeat protein
VRAICLVFAFITLAACNKSPTSSPPLRDVPLPDLTHADATVRDQVRHQYDVLKTVLDRNDATPAERAAEFGGLGMVLQAAEYQDSAEPAYLNAQTLAPSEPRWPYYLAHLYKKRGDNDRSKRAFERVLQLRPDDVPTLIWMARLALDRGDAAEAEQLLARADRVAPHNVAVLAGLGQAALLRRDFSTTVSRLEQALAIDSSATSLHSPLATAYRALGDADRAEAHARAWRNTDIPLQDPLREELDLAVNSAVSYELRGVRALQARDFGAAVGFFRQGVAASDVSTPIGRSLRHKLGTALYLTGDLDGATEQFTAVVNAAPRGVRDDSVAKAHYSLGVVMASRDRLDDAIAHLTAAVEQNPDYAEAHQALGDVLLRAHRDAAARTHYAEAARLKRGT